MGLRAMQHLPSLSVAAQFVHCCTMRATARCQANSTPAPYPLTRNSACSVSRLMPSIIAR